MAYRQLITRFGLPNNLVILPHIIRTIMLAFTSSRGHGSDMVSSAVSGDKHNKKSHLQQFLFRCIKEKRIDL
jgi:hypothetical protein